MSKYVLITGAAGGIGSAIAKKFIENGFKVVSIDLESADFGENFISEIADVTDIKSLLKIKEKYNNIEFKHLITLAGRALEDEWKPFKEQPIESLKESIDLNLVGHLNTIRIFYGQIQKSIITISSINAYGGFGLPVYSSGKAGLISFTRTVYKEFLKDGIRINTICPGTIVTDATLKEPKDFSELLKGTKNGRFATKQEVADLAFELCENSKESGEIKIIDEGQLEYSRNHERRCS
ncbi:MAG: SDR family oxidoreductase [Bacilli bacterium]|nr:SDR family oxidoreductase [Bacilli bacterium]